jgi:hypothetical protein
MTVQDNNTPAAVPARPARFGKRALAVLAGTLALCALWAVYEAGSLFTGYTRAHRDSQAVAALTVQLHDAEARLAAAEAARLVDRATYAEVERSVVELQAELQEQRQELAFYRSIVRPDNGIFGIHIQRLQILPGALPRHYRVRVVLSQANRDNKPSAATADFTVMGTKGGRQVTLALTALGSNAHPLSFSFRYFQEAETEIELPPDFLPQKVQLEVRAPQGRAPIRQSFGWRLESA